MVNANDLFWDLAAELHKVDKRVVEVVGRDDDAVHETRAEDPAQSLFLAAIAQPQHHSGCPIGEHVAHPVQQGDEVGVFEQDRGVNVHDHADDAGPSRGKGTGGEIGPVVGPLEDLEDLLPGLLGNRTTVDHP